MSERAEQFYIVDLERSRVSGGTVFWRANGAGYTLDADDAGLYTEAETQRLHMPSVAIPVEVFVPLKTIRLYPLGVLNTALRKDPTP